MVRLAIERLVGTFMVYAVTKALAFGISGLEKRGCLLSPVTFLMKICIVWTGSGDAERESGVDGCILSADCSVCRSRTAKGMFQTRSTSVL